MLTRAVETRQPAAGGCCWADWATGVAVVAASSNTDFELNSVTFEAFAVRYIFTESLCVTPIADDIPFGAKVNGLDLESTYSPNIREQMNRLLEIHGLLIFENIQPTNCMQAAISEIFGDDQAHDVGSQIPEGDNVKGFLDSENDGVVEVDGVQVENFLPWHFDQCYAAKLTRGGILRALSIVPEGGLTGFSDGIQLYNAVSPALRERFETFDILYDSALQFWNMRFGRPTSYKPVRVSKIVAEQLRSTSRVRSIHPAVWRRPTGEKVLHISPMQAAGIAGLESVEGDILLEQMCREMYSKMIPYYHRWKPTDMVIWDNWRFIHMVTGHSPAHVRNMRRTIIFGDYGLGRREH